MFDINNPFYLCVNCSKPIYWEVHKWRHVSIKYANKYGYEYGGDYEIRETGIMTRCYDKAVPDGGLGATPPACAAKNQAFWTHK